MKPRARQRATKASVILTAVLFAAIAGGLGAPEFFARAQETSAVRPGAIVKAQAYVSREPVAQRSTFEVAVVAEIPAAYHMNANKTSDEYLIPTTVSSNLPKGITQVDISYPPGKLKKFGFSETPLNVYEGRAVIRIKLVASTQVQVGSLEIPLTLRYQACNETTCFPPTHVLVTAALKLAPAGAASRPLHPEIFGKGM
jgi:hypothetical protein